MVENVMEHVAKAIGKDRVEVRLLNMLDEHKSMLQPMIEELCRNADYDTRKSAVEAFNNVRKVIHSN